jgi:hypothetical protein
MELDSFFDGLPWNAFNDAWEKSGKQMQELFGDKDDLPDDEMEIVWNDSFTHEEKVAKLKVLRASKEVKPRSFSKRLTKAGRLHALRGWA